ncbi:MAG: oxidoreductase [Chloroflexi bacterium]|nr:oxidoreductase [Chloroflexota bacterium]
MATEAKTSAEQYKVVGTSPIRHDGVDKVIGKATYGADINLPGMLYGKVLRSPHAHAVIKSIDLSKAEAHPDVLAIATAADFAVLGDELAELGEETYTALKYVRDKVMASDKALFRGHPIVGIAATSRHLAEELLSLVDVEYEVLPSVTNVEDAMKDTAPLLHQSMTTGGIDGDTASGTNISTHLELALGDVEKGLSEADRVFEREFKTTTVHQGYIEPQNGTAWWSPDGSLSVWCSSQGHFGTRDAIAKVLGLPESRVTINYMELGGGFGGKHGMYLEPIAAILSKKSGQPVKMWMTRTEVMEATGPTSGGTVKVEIGVTSEGKITAGRARIAFESGAYPGSSMGGAANNMFSPYDIENLRVDGYDVVDNKTKTGAYRAPGAPIGAFAVESLIDEIAADLGIDPIEFRVLNGAREGTRRLNGIVNPRVGMLEVAEAVKSHPHYTAPLEGENRGRGVAMGFWGNGAGPASATALVVSDGSVVLTIGTSDVGGSRVTAAQQLAEELGIPIEDVRPDVGSTDRIGYSSGAGGSGVTFKTGWAVYEAAQDVKRQLVERAAAIWETTPDQVEFTDGVVRHISDSELQTTLKELAPRLNSTGGPIVGRANLSASGPGGAHAADIVDVEVDPDTGKVQVLRATAFQDVGTAIHPGYVEGQIQGGMVQGIGWALNEEYYMSDDGQMMNSSLLDYRMPTVLDVPMIETVIVEVPHPGHPYGLRGVGEACLVPPLAAIANAVHNAIGIRMTELPMSPAAVSKAMTDRW